MLTNSQEWQSINIWAIWLRFLVLYDMVWLFNTYRDLQGDIGPPSAHAQVRQRTGGKHRQPTTEANWIWEKIKRNWELEILVRFKISKEMKEVGIMKFTERWLIGLEQPSPTSDHHVNPQATQLVSSRDTQPISVMATQPIPAQDLRITQAAIPHYTNPT